MLSVVSFYCLFFFKQKTAYEMRISDWSSDVCSSDLGEDLAAGCLVGQHDLLALGREDHRVLPSHVAAAQGGKADLAAGPGADLAFARHAGDLAQRHVAALRRRLAQHQRGAGGRVYLVSVMHLDDLDVVVGIEGPRHLLGHKLQQVRSEERRLGNGCVSTCRSRWSPYH